jgi:hypothetical protein
MTDLTIQLKQGAGSDSCGLCGRTTPHAAGPHLCRADNLDAVCRECGQRHAPSLVALLDLARVAERVGHIGRHTLTPPLEAMLHLVRAAENYTHTAAPPLSRPRRLVSAAPQPCAC